MSHDSSFAGKNDTATRNASAVLPLFALTLFVSAFLLFSVQPFFTKLVLPSLGGTPAVWSVAMVFFQTMLLAGYGYAHLITTRLSLRQGAYVHMAVMTIALFALPIALPSGWETPPETGHAVWLLGLFAVAVGLPFFAVSANGPLLQAWFARTGHPHAADPYFLYGASNIGSFASLLLYIILFEPVFALSEQATLWTGGFLVLGAAIAACAAFAVNGLGRSATSEQKRPTVSAPAKPGTVAWTDRLHWIWLAFVPSGLLVASTAHVSTDVASMPLIWVVPLALFLLTFVFAFARKPLLSIETLEKVVPGIGALAVLSIFLGAALPIWAQTALHFGYFFLATLLAHSVLASKRPHASELTGFYFLMSVGGVLGGIFTSLLAPALFDWRAEYPLLILASFLLGPSLWTGQRAISAKTITVAAALAMAFMLPPVSALVGSTGQSAVIVIFMALIAMGAIARFYSAAIFATLTIIAAAVPFALHQPTETYFAKRSFFGVLTAQTDAETGMATMSHGTTLHGSMRLDEEGKPTPLTYYHESGGIADALFAVQADKPDTERQIGVVGLGVGSLICHRKPGETWTHFEIDRDVVDLARDPRHFRFLSSCETAGDRMIVGDARLMLKHEEPGRFDYLLIDAFSSDSIPVHLLTTEALELYKSRITEDGIVVFHISNRHMELKTVVAAIAQQAGMVAREGFFRPSEQETEFGATKSQVMVVARDDARLEKLLKNPVWQRPDAGTTSAWTDDYSNVLAAILR